MRARPSRVFALLAFVAACRTFSVPSETCRPDAVNGKQTDGHPDAICSSCLEDKCCDVVGRCQNEANCGNEVSQAQSCVVAAGLRGGVVERGCANSFLKGSTALQTYQCMRGSCGESCGLPVCQLDPSASLIVNATCDNCLTGSCCDTINACYGNRTCKLILDCLSTDCKGSLGSTLSTLDATFASKQADAACNGDPTSFGTSCAQKCIDQFSQVEQGLLLDFGSTARCLSSRVVACATKASCGTSCTSL